MNKKGKRLKNTKEKKKTNNEDIKEVKKQKTKHTKLKKVLLTILIIIIVLIVIGCGIIFAILNGLIKGDWSLTEEDLAIAFSNSTILDLDGNVIGLLNGDENRIIISKDQMSEFLPKAFVSIEDERFEKHHGVDIKRTLSATLTFIMHRGSSSHGGSTITQQAIKNLTGDDDKSGMAGALRKVKEMVKAYQLENMWSKDQIIELYLNLIPLGGDIYGVEMAARKYFNKPASELNLVESAYLAGITNAPSTYNPFGDKPYGTDEAKTKRINKRVTDVLYKMHQLGKLNDEEYQAALKVIDEGIKFESGSTSLANQFSYHTEAAINQIKKELMDKYGWTEKETQIHLFGGGYTIYTTQDSNIQKIAEEAYTTNTENKKWVTTATYNGQKHNIQSGMVIIDHSTGYVVAEIGALGEKTAWGTNRGIQAGHSPGSSIKPLAVIGPSLQEGLINAGTVVDDTPVTFPGGDKPYSPNNDTFNFYGLMNIRYILRVSRNVPEVKMMNRLTVKKSEEYLSQLGITSMDGKEGLGLALGALHNGASPLEMAGGYATIANNGVYIEPTFYTKIVDKEGKVLIEKEQETHRVFSEQNAWILQSLLTEPTGTGLTGTSGATATGAVIKGMQTCGKTGTSTGTGGHKNNLWFSGFTPYYAASMYFGYDDQRITISGFGSGTVASRWASIMRPVHEGLESAKFEKPSEIITARVCSKSGLLATELCSNAGCAYNEYYVRGTAPTKSCITHVEATVCKETGKLADEGCKEIETKIFITRPNSDTDTAWQSAADKDLMLPTEKCEHKKVEEVQESHENENNQQTENNDNNENKSENNQTNTISNNTTTNTTTNTVSNITNNTVNNETEETSAASLSSNSSSSVGTQSNINKTEQDTNIEIDINN